MGAERGRSSLLHCPGLTDYKDSDDDNDDSYNDNDSAVKMNLSASSAILCTWVSSAHSALNTGVGQ